MHGLSWRIGLPFVLLVLVETVALAIYLSWRIEVDELARFSRLAEANARFIDTQSMPNTSLFAGQLGRVTGLSVFFRDGAGKLDPPPIEPDWEELLASLPADGQARRSGDLDLRGVVRPLRSLAAHLPAIDQPGPLQLREAARGDEIGDVARAFVHTRHALHREREHRERNEKLAVLGRMTAALAHEIQNPVAAIKMHSQLWQADPRHAAAGVIEHEASRIERLLNQWMFLTRPEPPAVAVTDLAELLAEVVRTMQFQLDHAKVRAVLHAPGPIAVRCDRKRIGQVFGNIVSNAIQAMPHGGTLTVTAHAGPAAEVSFADSGKGFSDLALARFGEFFFSEKEGGMGIGLGIAREIVRAHGGALRAQNREQGGACVTVTLPSEPVAPLALADAVPSGQSP
jgi:signal transduction histidine kinase